MPGKAVIGLSAGLGTPRRWPSFLTCPRRHHRRPDSGTMRALVEFRCAARVGRGLIGTGAG